MKIGFLATIGISALAGLAIVALIIFATAYASPTKSVKISVDRFGEANFEIVFMAFFAGIGAISIFSRKNANKKLLHNQSAEKQQFS